jgi:hypothetical protein
VAIEMIREHECSGIWIISVARLHDTEAGNREFAAVSVWRSSHRWNLGDIRSDRKSGTWPPQESFGSREFALNWKHGCSQSNRGNNSGSTDSWRNGSQIPECAAALSWHLFKSHQWCMEFWHCTLLHASERFSVKKLSRLSFCQNANSTILSLNTILSNENQKHKSKGCTAWIGANWWSAAANQVTQIYESFKFFSFWERRMTRALFTVVSFAVDNEDTQSEFHPQYPASLCSQFLFDSTVR